jgi:phosphoenolpyruvate carboxykinase (ATP)
MSAQIELPVEPRSIIFNPTHEQLADLIAKQENARRSEFGNLNVGTKVVARSKASTYVVTDNPEAHSDQTISRAAYAKISKLQEKHIRGRDMIVIDGYIGNDPKFQTPTRLIIETSAANIAAMQKHLYYDGPNIGSEDFTPELTVIYTPTLAVEGYPNDRLIAVDMDNGVTRVINSDYFGESKKGGLRMWNKLVYDRGGLSLHAGCKVIPVGSKKKVGLIIGLSGTGKTTTTFTNQNGSQPVQDDFVALMPGGKVYATENGCFAKTFGLDPEFEPAIYHAVTQPDAYLENVSMDDDGKVDFFDTSYTQNGRAVFPMKNVPGAADARGLGKADFLLILNRNENIIPAVVRLSGEQAAAYFMLGETKGTSAGGKEEAGKSLRVPGTNPFFPLLHAQQGNRILELLQSSPVEVYLMSTGRVGGTADEPSSKKVKIPHSSAVVKGIAEGTIEWEVDPDFGYEIARSVPGISAEDFDLLQPKVLYQKTGRLDEYNAHVKSLKKDRREYLESFQGLDRSIIDAL